MTKGSKICPKCNTENPQIANYCRHCGEKFDPTPEILDFRLNAKCHVGDYATLSWKTSNADRVTLNGQNVTDQEDYHIHVTCDTVYTLSATKGGHSVTKKLYVHIDSEDKRANRKTSAISNPSIFWNSTFYDIIGVIFYIVALILLLILLFNSECMQYYFGVSYSKWQTIKMILIIINGVISLLGFLDICSWIIKFFKNK